MTRLTLHAILILAAISSGVLAAPTSTPRSIVELRALPSSDPQIGGPLAVVNVLEPRAESEREENLEYLIQKLKTYLPQNHPNGDFESRIDRLRNIDQENGNVPAEAAAIMDDLLTFRHYEGLNEQTWLIITISPDKSSKKLKNMMATWTYLAASMTEWKDESDENARKFDTTVRARKQIVRDLLGKYWDEPNKSESDVKEKLDSIWVQLHRMMAVYHEFSGREVHDYERKPLIEL
ncbi:hypothetical protein EV360DRAFT_74269 [Lentinula raphanica]|nr:hypothetical protein EV360DRAFT_74269 [Lentinula raphanica]